MPKTKIKRTMEEEISRYAYAMGISWNEAYDRVAKQNYILERNKQKAREGLSEDTFRHF